MKESRYGDDVRALDSRGKRVALDEVGEHQRRDQVPRADDVDGVAGQTQVVLRGGAVRVALRRDRVDNRGVDLKKKILLKE